MLHARQPYLLVSSESYLGYGTALLMHRNSILCYYYYYIALFPKQKELKHFLGILSSQNVHNTNLYSFLLAYSVGNDASTFERLIII